MAEYLLKSERRKYPVREEEFDFVTGYYFTQRTTGEKRRPANKINDTEGLLNPGWKAIQRIQGNTLIIYSDFVKLIFIRRAYPIRYIPYYGQPKLTHMVEAGTFVEEPHKDVEFITCSLCLCDHAYFYCKQVQSKMVCEDRKRTR